MATRKQVEDAIFAREGFRVELEPFEGKKSPLPAYEFTAMAPQRWRISEWKNERLQPYRLLIKAVVVYRGDGTRAARDIQSEICGIRTSRRSADRFAWEQAANVANPSGQ